MMRWEYTTSENFKGEDAHIKFLNLILKGLTRNADVALPSIRWFALP